MNTVLSLIILIRQNSLKKDNHYIIADYILHHTQDMADKNIQEMAEDCHVSTNTILRFCQLLGFSTFKRFKNMLISTMNTRKLQLEEKHRHLKPSQLIASMQALASTSFDAQAFGSLLDQVGEDLWHYQKIHLYGAVFPLALSQSFIEDMTLLGVICEIHQFHYGIEELRADEGVHLIISYSGRLIEANRDEYNQILGMPGKKILVSRLPQAIGSVDLCLPLPPQNSSQFDDLFLLLIYDYLLLYYDRHQ